MGKRLTLINALIELGRVDKVPSERILSENKGRSEANDNRNSPVEESSRSGQDPSSSSPEPCDGPIS